MKDYLFSYNTSGDVLNETKVQFLARNNDFLNGKISNYKWDVVVNNNQTDWSLTLRAPDNYTSYWDLELNGDPITTFEFDLLSYLPNLIKVYQTILNKEVDMEHGFMPVKMLNIEEYDIKNLNK